MNSCRPLESKFQVSSLFKDQLCTFLLLTLPLILSVQVSSLKVVVDKKDLLAAPTVQKGEKGDRGGPGAPGLRGQPGSDVSNQKHLVMYIF